MDFDAVAALTGLAVGVIVGMTGMGGGALMTPVLVLLLGVNPLTAVSSDLVVSLVMKPVGGAVHARRGTVHMPLVIWLCVGSVPAAFAGVLILRALGSGGRSIEHIVKVALGVALLVAVATMVVKIFLTMRRHAREWVSGEAADADNAPLVLRKGPTVAVGVIGGLVVGMTSVGSGSLIIVMLLLLYPRLTASELVGTDLVQAVPLVGSAVVGHLLFGDVELALTVSLIVGAVPGAYLGARVSTRASQSLIRRMLAVVLAASGLKLIGLPTEVVGIVLLVAVVAGPLAWLMLRRAMGLPATWREERRIAHARAVPDPSGSSGVAQARGDAVDAEQQGPA